MKKTDLAVIACGLLGLLGCTSRNVQLDEETMQALLRQERESASRRIDAELAEWKPDPATKALTPIVKDMLADVLHPQADIEGDWRRFFFHEVSALAIRKKENGRYVVNFASGGCLADWELTREGTYADGILSLNRPVKEYCGWIYAALYAVSVDGEAYLVPEPGVLHLPVDHPKDASIDWTEDLLYHAYRRERKQRTQPDGCSGRGR